MLKKSIATRINKLSSSAKWTFVFAFLVVISMIVIGFEGESFAMVFDSAPQTFTADPWTEDDNIFPDSSIIITSKTANNRAFRIYCLEPDVPFCDGDTYTQEPEVNRDYGLNYILRNGYQDVLMPTVADREAVWVTQMAIWYYLDYDRLIAVEEYSAETIAQSRYNRADLWQEVDRLVEGARAATRPETNLSINWDDANFTLTADGNYLVSSLLRVTGTPASKFDRFSISIEGAPNGTVILNERMDLMTEVTDLAPGTRFYVKVPVDNITAGTATFAVEIAGIFHRYRLWNYTAPPVGGESCQRVVLVERYSADLSESVNVTVRFAPEVEDTNLFANRGVLAMGIIILLSGAGIIYANIKPKTQEQ